MDFQPAPIRVTVITPVFNEEASLGAFVQRVRDVLFNSSGYDVDILFVDDGSCDGSWEIIKGICRGDAHFSALRLSRNFGAHVALSAGIDAAEGDVVCTLACDLQDPPETILKFLLKWQEGHQIVWGYRQTREDAGWRIKASEVFQMLLKRYAMPRGSLFTTGSFLLMDKKVVECFRRFREQNRVTFALVAWTGFNQATVPYERKRRHAGLSHWKLSHMFKAMYDAFIGYSLLPVRAIALSGAFIFTLSILVSIYLVLQWLVGNPAPGWTSIIMVMTTMFGLLFLVMGFLGEYLHRIYTESVGRPLYFISDRIGPVADEARACSKC